jgi:hypothetical protein
MDYQEREVDREKKYKLVLTLIQTHPRGGLLKKKNF